MVLVVGRFVVNDADRFLAESDKFADLRRHHGCVSFRMFVASNATQRFLALLEFPSLGTAFTYMQTAPYLLRSNRDGIREFHLEYFTDIEASPLSKGA